MAKSENAAKVEEVGEPPNRWHLVEYGTWQISVAPDGLLMLPRHLHPREVADFVAAATAAAQVGAQVIAENEKQTKEPVIPEPSTAATVTEGPPPPGAVKMAVQAGAGPRSSIGRPTRRDPRQPAVQPTTLPPMPGQRVGARRG